jgi:hypothetical protein
MSTLEKIEKEKEDLGSIVAFRMIQKAEESAEDRERKQDVED